MERPSHFAAIIAFDIAITAIAFAFAAAFASGEIRLTFMWVFSIFSFIAIVVYQVRVIIRQMVDDLLADDADSEDSNKQAS